MPSEDHQIRFVLDGPLHGYAMIQHAEELSGGRVRLATGTLYTALEPLPARRRRASGHVS
jgi:DNA-binding PadR family transcriptional regulator